MKKESIIMRDVKKYLPLLGISVIFLIVSCGKNKDDIKKNSSVSAREDNVERQQIKNEEETYYDILLEDNALSLYEVCGKQRIPIKTINIDVSYYPLEDIEELKSGISAYSKEEGFKILENFVN